MAKKHKKENMIGLPDSLQGLVGRAQGLQTINNLPPIGEPEADSEPEPVAEVAPVVKPVVQAKPKPAPQPEPEVNDEWETFVESSMAYKKNKTEMETILIDKDMKHMVEFLRTIVGGKVTAKDVVSGIVRSFLIQNQTVINEAITGRRIG